MANRNRKSKPHNKPQNKRYSRKDDCKESKADEGSVKSPTNDAEFYTQTPELLRDAASLPFSNAAGTPYNRNVQFTEKNLVKISEDETVPGIMTLLIVPGIGDALDSQLPVAVSPLNIAAMAQYSFVRHANSGSANYDAPELMMYNMAVAQVYAYINMLQRVYGTCQLYTHYNRYLPMGIIQAQGVDFDSVISNLADFRYGINALIRKAASFACPDNMQYFRRLAMLFAGLYAEGESIKDQLYMYVPDGFFRLSEINSTPGWRLVYEQFYLTSEDNPNTRLLTVRELIAYGEKLLKPLLMSEEINIMSGDILKAYGSQILSLQTLPEVYSITPTTDLTVLEQFQNADFIGDANRDLVTFVVASDPDKNLLASACTINITGKNVPRLMLATKHRHLLTTILTNPQPIDIMERTRLMFTFELNGAGTELELAALHSGSEIATQLIIWEYDGKSNQYIGRDVEAVYYIDGSVTQSNAVQSLLMHCRLENFKFHPTVYYMQSLSEDPAQYQYFGAAVDIDNYTLIDDNTLKRMNEAALLSMFRVPTLAKFN